jgi:hypothetical protein
MRPITLFFRYLTFAGLLAVAGCQPREGRVAAHERELMHTGFEELDGWLPTPRPVGLTSEKAHTGRYAISVDPQHPYSLTYRARLGSLVPFHRPRRVTLSAWVWVPSAEADARFVFSISPGGDPEHPVFTKNIFLTDQGPYGTWKQVSRALDLPDNFDSNSQVVIYLWNAFSAAPVYADDLRLTELW